MRTFLASLALVAALGLAVNTVAFAGDEVPADKPMPTASKEMPAAKTDAPATATKSPIHTMMKWVASQVAPNAECGCPGTAEGEKAWRTWFAAKDGPLADLRTAMKKDGWNADRTIGFFKAMAAQKSCGGCDKSSDCSSGKCDCCDGCDKAKSGAAAPTGDAGATGDAKSSCCGGCNKAKDCSGCDKSKSKDCSGCDKAKKASGAAAPTGDAGTTGDAKSSCCGGCDKSKSKDCSGCDKAKKASGAAAPAGDAGTTGDSGKCPCTGKPMKDCGGCDKSTCPCGKDKSKEKAAPASAPKK